MPCSPTATTSIDAGRARASGAASGSARSCARSSRAGSRREPARSAPATGGTSCTDGARSRSRPVVRRRRDARSGPAGQRRRVGRATDASRVASSSIDPVGVVAVVPPDVDDSQPSRRDGAAPAGSHRGRVRRLGTRPRPADARRGRDRRARASSVARPGTRRRGGRRTRVSTPSRDRRNQPGGRRSSSDSPSSPAGRPGRRARDAATWRRRRAARSSSPLRDSAPCNARVVRAEPASGASRARVAAIVSTGIPSTVVTWSSTSARLRCTIAPSPTGGLAPRRTRRRWCASRLEPVEGVEASSGAVRYGVTPGVSAAAIARRRNVTGDPPATSTPGLGDSMAPSGAAGAGPAGRRRARGPGSTTRTVLSRHQGEECLARRHGCWRRWRKRNRRPATFTTGGHRCRQCEQLTDPATGPGSGADLSRDETGAMADLLTLDRRDDGVAVITLANGKVNALSGALLRELHAGGRRAGGRPARRRRDHRRRAHLRGRCRHLRVRRAGRGRADHGLRSTDARRHRRHAPVRDRRASPATRSVAVASWRWRATTASPDRGRCSASRRSSSASSRAAAERSAWPAWSARAGPRSCA